MPGRLDPDSRRGFPLEAQWDQEILSYHRQLTTLRHKYPALRTGSYQVLLAQRVTYIFARTLADQELIVAVNVGTEPTKVSFELKETVSSCPSKLLFGNVEWTKESNQLELSLPARAGCILGPAA